MIPGRSLRVISLGQPSTLAQMQAEVDASVATALQGGYVPEGIEALSGLAPVDALGLVVSRMPSQDWGQVMAAAILLVPATLANGGAEAFGAATSMAGTSTPSMRGGTMITVQIGGVDTDLLALLFTDGTPSGNALFGQAAIVYRPGAPSAGRFVETWAEVETAVAAQQGAITILVDDSIVSPAPIPPDADTECFGRVTIAPALNAAAGCFLSADDGARLRNLGSIERGVIFLCAPTVQSPLYFAPSPFRGFILNGSVLGFTAGATLPIIKQDCDFLALVSEAISALDNSAAPGVPVVRVVPAGAFLGWNAQQYVDQVLSPNLIQGVAGQTFQLSHDASVVYVPQSLFLGTQFETRLTKAEACDPSRGTTKPTVREVGQSFFYVTLGLPIWWNGTDWITAAGVIVP